MTSLEDQVNAVSDTLDKLATLGSPDQIAHYLEREGITGIPCAGHVCPIHEYVAREVTGVVFDVGTYTTKVLHGHATAFGMSNPLPIAEFIGLFDRHAYPALEAR